MAFSITLKRPAPPRRNRPLAEVEHEKQQKPLMGGLAVGHQQVKLKNLLIAVLLGGSLLLILGMVNRFQHNMPCKAAVITVLAEDDNAFADSLAIRDHLSETFSMKLEGEKMGNLPLEEIESAVEAYPFVEHAEVYKSFQGLLYIDASMKKPIGRVLNEDGSQFYLDEAGTKFPVSGLHTANVVLVRGAFTEPMAPVDSFDCVTIEAALPVLSYIREQPYWNAMISDVSIQQDGELMLYPRLGDFYIEFGQPVRITEKFENLRLFHEQVLRKVGWDAYRGVSLKYRGQVVGKKRS